MFCKFHKSKAQSVLEYVILLAVIVGALVVMQIYIKRGVQGRLREATDDIGEQFDPKHQNYTSTTKSTSTVHEETTKEGVTTQALETLGGVETPQKTLRWGQTKTDSLGETDWGKPTQ